MNDKRYVFHIAVGREEVEWRGLTLAQAKQMYNLTTKNPPADAIAWGWSEEK